MATSSLMKSTGNGMPSPFPRDPFQSFREEMNALFDRAFSQPLALWDSPAFGIGRASALMPQVDIHETDKAIQLTAELPGVDEKDIDISVHNGVLTLKGEKRDEKQEGGEGDARIVERHYGRFERSFTLPNGVDDAKIAAKFDRGVLTVTLPKRPEAQSSARHIQIAKT